MTLTISPCPREEAHMPPGSTCKCKHAECHARNHFPRSRSDFLDSDRMMIKSSHTYIYIYMYIYSMRVVLNAIHDVCTCMSEGGGIRSIDPVTPRSIYLKQRHETHCETSDSYCLHLKPHEDDVLRLKHWVLHEVIHTRFS